MNSITRLVLRWALNCFALFFVMKLVPGIQFDNFGDLLVGTLILGLLNVFIRPVFVLLTLPVTVLTLGLFTLVINGFMFYLAAQMVHGFRVAGFGTAMIAALLYSIFSFLLNLLFLPKK